METLGSRRTLILVLCWKGLVPFSPRLGSVGQWRVDEGLVLVSHDLLGVAGLHVADPPGLTFGRWLGKRGSHEGLLPTQCSEPSATPIPGTARWAHVLCPLLPSLGLSLPFFFALLVCECVCVVCEHVCLCKCEKGTWRMNDRKETPFVYSF